MDPALVLYYFDSKEQMFFEAVAQRLYPALESVFSGPQPHARIGEQILRGVLTLWDTEDEGNALAALVRAGVSNERIGTLFREYIESEILPAVAARVGAEPRELRVGLVASQLFGIGLARYVLRVGPVARADREELVAAVGPAITRYLTEPVGRPGPSRPRSRATHASAQGFRRAGSRSRRRR